jgi:cytochrome b subunit of formate dehydrogenase
MSKNIKGRVIVDVTMFISLLFSALTGLVIWLALPDGRQSGRTLFLGLSKTFWGDVHLYSSLIFLAIFIGHIYLNLRLFFSMMNAILRKKHDK